MLDKQPFGMNHWVSMNCWPFAMVCTWYITQRFSKTSGLVSTGINIIVIMYYILMIVCTYICHIGLFTRCYKCSLLGMLGWEGRTRLLGQWNFSAQRWATGKVWINFYYGLEFNSLLCVHRLTVAVCLEWSCCVAWTHWDYWYWKTQ